MKAAELEAAEVNADIWGGGTEAMEAANRWSRRRLVRCVMAERPKMPLTLWLLPSRFFRSWERLVEFLISTVP